MLIVLFTIGLLWTRRLTSAHLVLTRTRRGGRKVSPMQKVVLFLCQHRNLDGVLTTSNELDIYAGIQWLEQRQ